ncbi:MAG: alpha/beta fold hydrolase [Gammaproteobacteria bacterium]|nr:alpha/beta fold hydrolase [Gammaproteobacteria bacterium]
MGYLLTSLIFIAPVPSAVAESDLPPDAPAILTIDELQDCSLHAPSGLRRIDARCGWFEVTENRDDAGGKKIRLHVALVPAVDETASGSPLALLAGGPGGSAQDFYTGMAGALSRVREKHPILLVDQRGTGMSNRLACEQQEEIEDQEWSQELVREAVSECLDSLDNDSRYYTTSVAVRDLDEVRQALGFEQLNLLGGSYGTRVALHYLRRYPQATRAVIIDGVIPADMSLGPGIAVQAQKALDMGFARCAADPACHEAFPDPAADLKLLREQLTSQHLVLTLPDPLTGELLEERFSEMHMAVAIRMLNYSPQTVALIPLLLKEAVNGNPTPMLAQTLMISSSINEALALGMHNAVVCAEDIPFIDDPESYRQELEKTFLGTMMLDSLTAICDVWPAGIIDDDFKTPVISDKPVLLLSGEADPITPPSYAEQAMATLSNSQHIELTGQGHGQLGNGCVPKLLGEFIANPDSLPLDKSCAELTQPVGFFLDFNGPAP